MDDWLALPGIKDLPNSCCHSLNLDNICTNELASKSGCRQAVIVFFHLFNIVYTALDLVIVVLQVSNCIKKTERLN